MLTSMLTLSLAAVLGAGAGGWVSMAVRRVPGGEPIVRRWPRCHACDAYLPGRDLIPVVSWFLLKGRCRCCTAALGYRYLAYELGTAVLFVLFAARFGPSVELIAYGYFAAVCVALFVIDVKVHRLPDALTLPAYGVIVGILLIAAASTGSGGIFSSR